MQDSSEVQAAAGAPAGRPDGAPDAGARRKLAAKKRKLEMNVVHRISVKEKNSVIDLGEVPRGQGCLKSGLESVAEALARAIPEELLKRILEIVNKVYDERMNLRAARGWERAFAPREVVREEREVVAAAKRTPAPAEGVVIQRKTRSVAVQVMRRSPRIGGLAADDAITGAWYDRVPFTTKITLNELKAWLALMWRCSLDTPNSFARLWAQGEGVQYLFATRLFSRERAAEIYRAFKFSHEEVLEIQTELNDATRRNWLAATVAVVDESMAPTKIHKNPHHVFIARKPKSNGIKIWMTVDFSGVVIKMSMFERVQPDGTVKPPEKTTDTLLRMVKELPEGSVIVGDSLFGSLQAAEELSKAGYEAILSCRTDRPRALFEQIFEQEDLDMLDYGVAQCFIRPKEPEAKGHSESAQHAAAASAARSDASAARSTRRSAAANARAAATAAQAEEARILEAAKASAAALGIDPEAEPRYLDRLKDMAREATLRTKPVLAVAQKVKGGRTVNTIATVSSTAPVQTQQERLVRDSTDEDARQHVFQGGDETRPQVRGDYTDLMEFVDEVDRVVLASMPFFRWHNWGAVVVFQQLTVAGMNNAKHFYRSGTGKVHPIPPAKWIKEVYEAWTPQCELFAIGNGKRRKCKVCWIQGRDNQTAWRCKHCDAICRHCTGICTDVRSRGRKRAPCTIGWCYKNDLRHNLYVTGRLVSARPQNSALVGASYDRDKQEAD